MPCRRRRYLELERCKDCPNCRIDAFNKKKDQCVAKNRHIPSINTVPKWCPLPEIEDLQLA